MVCLLHPKGSLSLQDALTSPTQQILSLISSVGKLRHGTALRGHMLILWLSRECRQGLLPAGPVL